MSEAKKAEAIGPLEQFQFILYASKDTGLSAGDLAVLSEITDRYIKRDIGKKHKAGVTFPTGHTHLVRETGLAIATVKASLARLRGAGYISVAVEGIGTRGSEYVPNFNWSRTVAAAIKKEVDARGTAKGKRRRASGVLHHTTNTTSLVVCSTTPLRDIVGCYTNLLSNVVGCSTTPQTYVYPKGTYIGGATTAVDGVMPPRDGAPLKERKIVTAVVESEDGEKWLSLEFEDGGGDAIALESSDADTQAEGQKVLEQLAASAGLSEINQPAELIGRVVYMQGGRYVAAPESLLSLFDKTDFADDMQDAA